MSVCLLPNCNNEAVGRAKTCSNAHRMALSRLKTVTPEHETVTESVTTAPQTVTKPQTVTETVTSTTGSVTNEAKSVTERVKTNRGIVTITVKGSEVFENGILVPESELNSFYRGSRGVYELICDLVPLGKTTPIVLREKDRIELTQTRKST